MQGEVYPPPALNVFLAQLFSLLFMLGLGLGFVGDKIFDHLQIPIGVRLCTWMKNNMMTVVLFLMVLNWIGGQLLSTGAFEVYANEYLIHSKLETGQLPDMNQLIHTIRLIAAGTYEE